jgi:hypothetical protein
MTCAKKQPRSKFDTTEVEGERVRACRHREATSHSRKLNVCRGYVFPLFKNSPLCRQLDVDHSSTIARASFQESARS